MLEKIKMRDMGAIKYYSKKFKKIVFIKHYLGCAYIKVKKDRWARCNPTNYDLIFSDSSPLTVITIKDDFDFNLRGV